MKVDVYTKITEDIIKMLEKGEVVWRKQWKYAGVHRHSNFKTKSPYRGINAFITHIKAMVEGYESPYWITYKQAEELGGVIKKGSKSTSIVFYTKSWFDKNGKWHKQPKGVSDKEMIEQGYKKYLSPRYYNVFNLDQVEGIEWNVNAPDYSHNDIIQHAERIINDMPNKPVYHIIETDRACYCPSEDWIQMPLIEQFESSDAYYSTFFHEMVHSTGHESRLNREGITSNAFFGDETYSKEELVAEIGACFLSAETGILQQEIDNSVAYLQSWIKQLKDDSKLIWKASQDAQKAVDYILSSTDEA